MNGAGLGAELRRRQGELAGHTVVAGFDAFVDTLLALPDADGGLAGLGATGAWIAGCAGRNGLRRASARVSAGGCAINLGDGAAALGLAVEVFAAAGEPVHPAFAPLAARCRAFTSWAPFHGATTAIEGRDGKAMLATVDALAGFTPELLAERLADGAYRDACARASVLAWTNWSLFPAMTACWDLLTREVLARLPRPPVLLVDLVDPSGAEPAALAAMAAGLRAMQEHATVVLAVNLRECAHLSACAGLPAVQGGEALAAAAARLRAALGVARVVVHHRDGDAEADIRDACFSPPAPPCTAPRRSTGAGDRFNAGWIAGWCLAWPPAGRLALAAAAAGAFVADGVSPDAVRVAAALAARGDG